LTPVTGTEGTTAAAAAGTHAALAVTVSAADPLLPLGSVAVSVCAPGAALQGTVKEAEPVPEAFVVTVPRVTGELCRTTVNVSVVQFPETDTVTVPSCATVAGPTVTAGVHAFGP
jgi:hypothetical protein